MESIPEQGKQIKIHKKGFKTFDEANSYAKIIEDKDSIRRIFQRKSSEFNYRRIS